VADETAGTWNQSAIELITVAMEDKRDGVPIQATVHCSPKMECGFLATLDAV